jgi:hypothetical protein
MALDFIVGDIHYKAELDGTCSVSGSQLVRGCVVIPESVLNAGIRYSVIKLGSAAFFQNSSISSISFDANSRVFAFENACFRSSSLALLNLPPMLTYFHRDTFRQTPNLAAVVPGDNAQFVLDGDSLYNIDRTSLLFCPRGRAADFVVPHGVTRVGPWAFSHCRRLQSISFDGVIDELDDGAFSECGINVFVVPKSVMRLGDFCFENCDRLAEIVFEAPSKVVVVPHAAFAGCPLVAIRFPASVSVLCSRCIADTQFLKTVSFDEGSALRAIQSDVFSATSLEVLEIPASVESIEPANFFAAERLTTINLAPGNAFFVFAEDGVLATGNRRMALFGLRSIRNVAFPPELEHVGANAFYESRDLSRVVFPEGLRSIGEGAFGYTAIVELQMPDSLVIIGRNAFTHWESLVDCAFRRTSRLRTIGAGAFCCTGITFFAVPESVIDIGDQAFANSGLRSIRLPPSVARVPPLLFFGCRDL